MTRPPFPTVLDSTIISNFRSCPQRVFLEQVQHWKPKTQSVHLHAGKAFAHGLEVTRRAFYEQGRTEDDAIAAGTGALLEAYGGFECPPDSAKSAARMAGALVYYFDAYPMETDQAQPHVLPSGGRAIEFSFLEPLDLLHPETGDPLLYSGRFDMVADFAGGLFGFDDKTTSSLGASWSRQWDLRSQFTSYCLLPETEVLTLTGWKALERLKEGEEIAQWHKDGSLTWALPTQIHSPNFKGDMITCEGKVNFVSTPDHRQIVWDSYSKRYKEYTSLTTPRRSGALRFLSGGKLVGGEEWPKAFIQLLVAIQADGSWKDGGVRFHFSKDRKASRLENLLQDLEIPCHWHSTCDWSVQLKSPWIDKAYKVLGDRKDFGTWLLGLGQETLETFIQEVGHWDGCLKESSSGWMYFSSQKSNVDWVRTVVTLTGRYSSYHTQSDPKGSVQHRIYISDGCKHSPHLHNWGTLPYEGKVYCVTVPSSFFLIRYKGRSMITGNCWGAGRTGLDLAGFLVRGVSILKTKYETLQAITYRPAWMVELWYQQTLRDVERMIACWESGWWDYNLAEACTEYGGCGFRKICQTNGEQKVTWLEAEFERRVWNPVTRVETLL